MAISSSCNVLVDETSFKVAHFRFCFCFCLCGQAFDQHLNMILGDVEEVITTVEIDDETYEEIVRVLTSFNCRIYV